MTDEEERTYIDLYQTFYSLHDDIYALFEKKYLARLHQISYRNPDLLQEQKLTLHLTLLSFDVWNKEKSFFSYLCKTTLSALQYVNKMEGYQYWSLRTAGKSPVHIPLDKNYSSNGSNKGDLKDSSDDIAEALADKHPSIEEILLEEEDIKEQRQYIKEYSANHELLLKVTEIASRVDRHKRDPEVRKALSDLAKEYKHIIAPNHIWHKEDRDRSPELMTYVRGEINRLRLLNGKEPIKNVFNKLAKLQNRDRLKRWMQDWYNSHKEQQRAYYQNYNAKKRKK